MSATLTKKSWKKAKIWKNTFAPRRPAWHESARAVRIEPKRGVGIIFAASLLLFGGVFSANALLSPFAPPLRQAALQAILMPQQSSQLAAAAWYVTDMLHVPGAYTDTSAQPPALVAPSFPVSLQDAHAELSFVPFLPGSLAQTAAAVWGNSIGLTADVFVASVYEMGNESTKTFNSEFNALYAGN